MDVPPCFVPAWHNCYGAKTQTQGAKLIKQTYELWDWKNCHFEQSEKS